MPNLGLGPWPEAKQISEEGALLALAFWHSSWVLLKSIPQHCRDSHFFFFFSRNDSFSMVYIIFKIIYFPQHCPLISQEKCQISLTLAEREVPDLKISWHLLKNDSLLIIIL